MLREVYRTAVATAALALAVNAAGCTRPAGEDAGTARWAETRRLMGVPWTITVAGVDEAAARTAIAAAFAEVARLERVLSDYDPESELAVLSARAPMAVAEPVSDDLWAVLARAAEIRDATDGAFDISVGPLTTLWRRARRSERLPPPEKLAAALAAVGPGAVELDADRRAVRLPRAGTRLDAGGIGMGYAADRALEVLASHRISAAMVDASGDVVVSGPPPGTDGWRIALDPLGRCAAADGPLVLAHAAVTTSGDARQCVEIDGRRYSHVVDPRTGLGVPGPAAATVIARNGTTADALATAASVLGPDAGPAVVESFPGAAAMFTWQDAQGEMHESASVGWPSR
ncbi:MAG: FAD:protein FMN transferase [Planctomycetaceae bacterium]